MHLSERREKLSSKIFSNRKGGEKTRQEVATILEENQAPTRPWYQVDKTNAKEIPLSELRVLVVEDDVGPCMGYQKMLIEQGCMEDNVDTAFNGEEALAKLSAGQYDLVLLDHDMPRKGGANVVHELAQMYTEQKVSYFPTVIATTSHTRDTIENDYGKTYPYLVYADTFVAKTSLFEVFRGLDAQDNPLRQALAANKCIISS